MINNRLILLFSAFLWQLLLVSCVGEKMSLEKCEICNNISQKEVFVTTVFQYLKKNHDGIEVALLKSIIDHGEFELCNPLILNDFAVGGFIQADGIMYHDCTVEKKPKSIQLLDVTLLDHCPPEYILDPNSNSDIFQTWGIVQIFFEGSEIKFPCDSLVRYVSFSNETADTISMNANSGYNFIGNKGILENDKISLMPSCIRSEGGTPDLVSAKLEEMIFIMLCESNSIKFNLEGNKIVVESPEHQLKLIGVLIESED